ncbi:hypothetical protein FRC11_005323 [Ceratobasidium sp. 423]|nr:hypothetical protein FRC11_005323 [Ceratobasidium sp. 423]
MDTRVPKTGIHTLNPSPTHILKKDKTVPTTFEPTSIIAQQEDTVEDLRKKIELYLITHKRTAVVIKDISKKKARALDQAFEAAGLKFKFDWDARTNSATIMTPSRLHSSTLAAWIGGVSQILIDFVKNVAPCQFQLLSLGGDAAVKLDNGSSYSPDASFTIREGTTSNNIEWTRVVIESLVSQPLKEGRSKARDYLRDTNGVVHVVILINFEDLPTRRLKSRCRVTIEVWVREEYEEQIKVFRDACPWSTDKIDNDIYSDNDDDDGEEDDSDISSENDSEYEYEVLSDTSTKVDRDGNMPVLSSEAPADPIPTGVRMRGRPLLVLDENRNNVEVPDEELELDAYDFLRICADGNKEIKPGERTVKLPLSQLRDSVKSALDDMRRAVKARNEKKKARLEQSKTRRGETEASTSIQEGAGPMRTAKRNRAGHT